MFNNLKTTESLGQTPSLITSPQKIYYYYYYYYYISISNYKQHKILSRLLPHLLVQKTNMLNNMPNFILLLNLKKKLSLFHSVAQQPCSGLGHLIVEVSRSYTDTPHSVGILWKRDQPVRMTSTWQHTIFTTERYPCPRQDSNPQPQEASGRKPTP